MTTPPALPSLVRRSRDPLVYRNALDAGVPEVVARVIAGRGLPPGTDIRRFLEAKLSDLDPPGTLADIDRAAGRVANAILSGEVLALATDYDCDGLDAHGVLHTALVKSFKHPGEKLRGFVGHRLKEGYGICEAIANRILADRPRASVLITADNGSSDETQIARLKSAQVDVCVADHHEIPKEGPPQSAFAVINPQRADCRYPDDAIAGGMVAWLLMCAVRQRLIEADHLPVSANPLVELLDYVAMSTVCDAVSMASVNNRAVVRAGLALMNARPRACWQALKSLLNVSLITADTLGWSFGPLLNGQTRMSDGEVALAFLLSEDVESARPIAEVLVASNEARKRVEREMLRVALAQAESSVAAGRAGLALLLEDGHAGVIGLCSSRIVERFGRPTFVFAPKHGEPDLVTGSGRSIEGVHLRDALQRIADQHPGLQNRYGGHRAACGSAVGLKNFQMFAEAFDEAVRSQIGERELRPMRYSDGDLAPHELSLETVQKLEILEPTGRGFERAAFDGLFTVQDVRTVGDGTHLKLLLEYGGRRVPGIWFKARANAEAPLPLERGESAHFVYGLRLNEFRGERRLDVVIEARVG